MTYKFWISYIHNSFIRKNPSMHPNHPDYRNAISTTEMEAFYELPISLEDAKQNIVEAMERGDCTVVSIDGRQE